MPWNIIAPADAAGRVLVQEECCWNRGGSTSPNMPLHLYTWLAKREGPVTFSKAPRPGVRNAMIFSWIFGPDLDTLAASCDLLVANPTSSAPALQKLFPKHMVLPAADLFASIRDDPLPVHLLDPGDGHWPWPVRSVTYQLSSGCPWGCPFCVWAHARARRPLDLIAADLAALRARYPAAFNDPDGDGLCLLCNEITGNESWLINLLTAMPPALWNSDVNIRTADAGELQTAAAYGLRRACLGIEFLADSALARLGKGHTVADAFHVMDLLQRLNVKFRFSLRQCVGETVDEMDSLLTNLDALAERGLHPDAIYIGPMHAWPGATWDAGPDPVNDGTPRFPRLHRRNSPEITSLWAEVAALCREQGWTR